jgi:hypothetical protein
MQPVLRETGGLDSDPEPDNVPQPLLFQFCESAGVATITSLFQLTWQSSRGLFD